MIFSVYSILQEVLSDEEDALCLTHDLYDRFCSLC